MAMLKWATRILSETQATQVQDAVAKAESRTSGEIVPMMVRRSSPVGHVPMVLFFVFLICTSMCVPWVSRYNEFAPPWASEVAAVIVAILLTWLCHGAHFFQRLCTPRADQAASVFHRAQLEFYLSGIKATDAHTGVLIFISVMERRAVVLADQGIAEKLSEETWRKVVDQLIHRIKAQQLTEGLIEAIETVGTLLEAQFPILPGDVNELSNALVIKD